MADDEPPAQRARGAHDPRRVEELVTRLQQSRNQVKHVCWLPGKEAVTGTLQPGLLPAAVMCVLARAGALPLYSHQVEAITAALTGNSVVVSTPTASGKSVWCARRAGCDLRTELWRVEAELWTEL